MLLMIARAKPAPAAAPATNNCQGSQRINDGNPVRIVISYPPCSSGSWAVL